MEGICKGMGIAEICEVENRSWGGRQGRSREFKALRDRASFNPFLLQKTREFFPRETEQSHRKGLQPNDWLPDSHSLMWCFSKFSLPTVADLPTIYYLSKQFIMNRTNNALSAFLSSTVLLRPSLVKHCPQTKSFQ